MTQKRTPKRGYVLPLSEETDDWWRWTNKEGENPRRKFSDEALLDVYRNCKSRKTEDRFAHKYEMSVKYIRAIRSKGRQLPIIRKALEREKARSCTE